MSRGRMLDFIFLTVAVLIILVTQMFAASLLDQVRTVVFDIGVNTEIINGRQHINQIYIAVVKWVPYTVAGGLATLATYREYRRQKLSGLSQGPRF